MQTMKKQAYRKLAKKYHPDLNNGSKQAEAKMQELNEAYAYLIKNKNNPSYTQSSNPFDNSGYNNSSQGNYQEFDFYDFFNSFAKQQSYNTYSQRSAYSDPVFSAVEEAILDGQNAKAINMLEKIISRNAQWHFLYARASLNLGNKLTALQHAKTAVQMNPNNEQYRDFLNQISYGTTQYQTTGRQFGFNNSLCSNSCFSLLALNLLCNCCLNRRGCC